MKDAGFRHEARNTLIFAKSHGSLFTVKTIGQTMQYKDLREFIHQLEEKGELKRISLEVDPYLEMTEICDRCLRASGPALLFENPKGHSTPVLGNLFGTPRRVAMGMGEDDPEKLREIGKLLAFLKESP